MPATAAPTTDDVTALRRYVSAVSADDPFLRSCLTRATALVGRRIAGVTIPDDVAALAVQEVAADLFHRRSVRNGLAAFDGPDLTPVRVTRDPMKAAEEILRPYVGWGIA